MPVHLHTQPQGHHVPNIQALYSEKKKTPNTKSVCNNHYLLITLWGKWDPLNQVPVRIYILLIQETSYWI